MRETFVHQARLELPGDGDDRAPGAAVTVALCGHWEHEPPCRVPHHTAVARRAGEEVVVRVVFACPSEEADAVTTTVSEALRAGRLGVPGPGGGVPGPWRVLDQGRSTLLAAERPLAGRLAGLPEA